MFSLGLVATALPLRTADSSSAAAMSEFVDGIVKEKKEMKGESVEPEIDKDKAEMMG